MSKTLPSNGDPSRVLIAAKLPALAMMRMAVGGESFLIARMASPPSPPPSAISGASGPRTAPSASVASAANTTPGNSIGSGAPPGFESLGRRMTAVAREITDGQGDEQAATVPAVAPATRPELS